MLDQSFQTALSELTLVLFTTLAPSGAFAFLVVVIYQLIARPEPLERRRIDKMLVLPLTISMIGLIASATHLGNPSNALYVFLGVGRSPLATEVFCAVLFLMFAGLYWLNSFSLKERPTLRRVWLILIVAAGVVFITSIALAYNVDAIISWSVPFVPLNVWFNALVGGSLLGLFTLQISQVPDLAESKFAKGLCVVAGFALLANVITMVLQNAELPSIENALTTAAELVPFYGWVITAFVVLCLCGLAIYTLKLRQKKLPSLAGGIVACLSVFVGIFLTRFAFYMMHMTPGVNI